MASRGPIDRRTSLRLGAALSGVALGLAVGCSPGTRPPPAAVDLVALLPEISTLDGWSVAEGPRTYDPDALYEVLDGGAERYLGYGFRQLVRVRYGIAGAPDAGVTLELFDMGGQLGAFGIYRAGLPPEPELRDWGVEGYLSGTVAAAWRGPLFVHAEADDDRPVLTAALERLVAGVCERASGDPTPPSILRPLPPGGLVPSSERWVASGLLGHAALPGGVLATYRLDGGDGTLFFSGLVDEERAAEALAALRDHHRRRGEVTGELSDPGAGGFTFSDPRLGAGTVVRAGRFVAGVHGGLGDEARARLLERLVAGLRGPESDGWDLGEGRPKIQ